MKNTPHPARLRALAATCVLAFFGLLPKAWAGDVFVIANANVTIKAEDIHDVFTGELQAAGGVHLVPVDNAAAQADFLAKVLKMDSAKYANVWAKKGFREGINPPSVRHNDAEVIANIRSTPGAVGYVSKAPGDVKVIQKF